MSAQQFPIKRKECNRKEVSAVSFEATHSRKNSKVPVFPKGIRHNATLKLAMHSWVQLQFDIRFLLPFANTSAACSI